MAELEAWQRPGPEEGIAAEVVTILEFYATGSSSELQGRVKAEVWIETLSDLPAGAVHEARRRWFRNHIREARGFAPDPGDIRREAEGIVKALRGQWAALRRILAAEPAPAELSQEERERIVERLREVSPALRPMNERASDDA